MLDIWHGVVAVAGVVLGTTGKYAFKLMLNGAKKDKEKPEANGKAGSQSTLWWLEQNDKMMKENMSPLTEALKDIREINTRMAEGITKLVTIAEIKWK